MWPKTGCDGRDLRRPTHNLATPNYWAPPGQTRSLRVLSGRVAETAEPGGDIHSGFRRCPALCGTAGVRWHRGIVAGRWGAAPGAGVTASRQAPASKVRTSPTVRSCLVGSGSGRCDWIW